MIDIAGLENEVNLTLATEGSATDDFDVDALLDLQSSGSFSKTPKRKEKEKEKEKDATSINASKLNLNLMDGGRYVDSNMNSISPKNNKTGKKPTSGMTKQTVYYFIILLLCYIIPCLLLTFFFSFSWIIHSHK